MYKQRRIGRVQTDILVRLMVEIVSNAGHSVRKNLGLRHYN